LFLVGLAAIVVAGVLGYRRPSRHPSPGQAVRLAGAAKYLDLPAVKAGIDRGRRSAIATLVLAAVTASGATLVAARPVERQDITAEVRNRDVVLCLDVSGSMAETNLGLIEAYLALVEGFRGERVALSIFNARSVTVFPLTDDYDFMRTKLEEVSRMIEASQEDFIGSLALLATLDPVGDYSSLIPDGLATCVLMFDKQDEQRSRSIVFATDNELNGTPLVTMAEAVAYANQMKAKVYAIDPASEISRLEARELEEAALATGGQFFDAYDLDTIDEVIRRIAAEQAAPIKLPPRTVVTDLLGLGAWLIGLGTVALVVVLTWSVGQVRRRRD